ncbi:MAG TPA: CoA ester lyase [Dehalococcoidia bacterium]|nr:CoA ester lyase [Dehalococcoidia bacterium]
MPPLRSWLFTPGNRIDRMEKAMGLGADVIILDLEDAVAYDEKESARVNIRSVLDRWRGPLAYVRINPISADNAFSVNQGRQDLEAVVGPELNGIVFPKAESGTDARAIDTLIGQLEQERGVPAGTIDLMPIIETAKGLFNSLEVLTSTPRIRRVSFGAGDFTRDLNLEWTPTEVELLYARSHITTMSRVADREPPIDSVFITIADLAGCERSARHAKTLGFQGKMAIHPGQVAPINAAFSPTEDEIAWAKRLIAAFAEAERQGLAALNFEGTMIDYPIVEKAKRILGR